MTPPTNTSGAAPDALIPVPGAEDVMADPNTAAVLAGRLRRGEITPDELRDILAGKHNARPDAATSEP